VTKEELEKFIEQKIEKGRIDLSSKIDLTFYGLTRLSEKIGTLSTLKELYLQGNQLISLPESIGCLSNLNKLSVRENRLNSVPESIKNLSNLTYLELPGNELTDIPESIYNLTNLTYLNLCSNQIKDLHDNIGNLTKITCLILSNNQLKSLPNSIVKLHNLNTLYLSENQFTDIPRWIENLSNLTEIDLSGNILTDLSILQNLSRLEKVRLFYIDLPRRYWIKFSDWNPKWLLDEENTEVRRVLIEQVGYEKICKELDAIKIDNWRGYTLLKINDIELVYDEDIYLVYNEDSYEEDAAEEINREDIDKKNKEPMVLLKMTCPSMAHIHILRVPPEMTSAEAAITWVNHGIHPDQFIVQT
jgi:leucine-rich repeat protein SHOC2